MPIPSTSHQQISWNFPPSSLKNQVRVAEKRNPEKSENPDDSNHIYACSDDTSYYAAPIFLNSSTIRKLGEAEEVPKKPAPCLSRQSTCRPTSQLYLPSKKRKK
ncbi:unnamed protein product [Caenorhabditis angaria]|uniref:Uncharacterized protein n=1 Tax=Caenorhabditis angaria TaxID=860376 RepID=A0A9P1N4I4_9PELO|nr:unnamed protein product [Caenorhabditis angaria]